MLRTSILVSLPLVLSLMWVAHMVHEPVRISDFTLPNAVSGQSFTLSEAGDAKAVVVIFTSHYCPYAKLYGQRINSLISTFQGQPVRFVLINSNNPNKSTPDSRTNIIKEAQRANLTIPYLIDSTQKVADMFGAQKTPEAFVLKKGKSGYEVVYQGAIDNNPQVATDVDHNFLKEAVESVLTGRSPRQAYNHPTGCMIRR